MVLEVSSSNCGVIIFIDTVFAFDILCLYQIQQGASIRKLWLLNRYTGFYCWKLCGHCSGGIDVVGWDVGGLLPSLSVCEQ